MIQIFKILKKIVTSIVVLSLSVTSIVILAGQTPLPGGWHWYSVLTGSMSPTLPVGSLLITHKPESAATLPAGTIITFSQPGNASVLITHRIYDTQQGSGLFSFMTKGDANPKPDIWLVKPEQIKGVYVTHIPHLGYGLEFIKSPVGILLLIVGPTIFIAILEIRTIIALRVRQQVTAFINGNQQLLIVVLVGSYLLLKVTNTWAAWPSNTVTLRHNQITTASDITSLPSTTCPPLNVNIQQENINTGAGSTNTNTTVIHNECHINIQNIVY